MQIVCENLAIGHAGRAIHKDISFGITAGSYVCVVGQNGSGKSTLMKTMLGLLPPISGGVRLEDGLKSREMGYLPQQTQLQKDFPASVNEVVLSGCLNRVGLRPFYTKNERVLAKSRLQKLGITHLAKKSYSELSGGQQQRVLLARALCATRKVLLLDEPTAGLDIGASRNFYDILRQLNREGVTVIIITHEPQKVLADASYVLHVSADSVQYIPAKQYTESEVQHG